mmetsp:Transcript_11369/g.19422  ORF Transcript_11369/g.19422 Transcript_11369/m.19422 type:complete len:1208 (+) Transcript_11369:235-3858(+)|eukprot:CAMPEP_0198202702 /NCGR_PEP_ID=MMETSP1445-20131203/5901_1 /TAXON_ID=36898 /ORGANISM="Pyramimonas sp., Strain CCMP2087" /LENGTH=1207 /DNA_ID=CAMNT_0043873755 /DNA_START=232 /DNA_END=3855 /DNA_ORIENTATION=-
MAPDELSTPEKNWRRAILTVNATRRFRYTNYQPGAHKKEVEYSSSFSSRNSDKSAKVEPEATELAKKRWTTTVNTVLATNRFKFAITSSSKPVGKVDVDFRMDDAVPTLPNGFGITQQQLIDLLELPHEIERIVEVGGPKRVAKCLHVNTDVGLPEDPTKQEAYVLAFGRNVIKEQPAKPFWEYCYEATQDPTLILLVVCAAAALGTGIAIEGPATGWYDGTGIMFAILLVVFVTAINDYKQALQFRDLDAKNKDLRVNVLRSGMKHEISVYEILVGDVVMLATGDQIVADGLVLTAQSMELDESTMTGESDLLKKDPKHSPLLLSGTKVVDGYGTMLVTAVGQNTEWGRLMASGTDPEEADAKLAKLEVVFEEQKVTEEEYKRQKEELELEAASSGETPLQIRLNGLASSIGKLGLAVAVVVLVILVTRFLIEERWTEGGSNTANTMVEYFAIAVTIVVVAVPEGLPLAVTLSLAYSMKKMMQDNALVRHLAACETMGGVTNLCSDKTGTLTTNTMTVVKTWVMGCKRENEDRDAASTLDSFAASAKSLIFETMFSNAEGEVFSVGGDGQVLAVPVVTGKPTEMALLKYGLGLGGTPETGLSQVKILKKDPFSSEKKRMGCAVRDTGDNSVRVHWKGASEIVLGLCNRKMGQDGRVSAMSAGDKQELEAMIQSMAENSLRTICFAYSSLPAATVIGEEDDIPDKELVCLAIVGIKDPCRPGVPEAVARCQKAGIVVRMVTGDNVMTAKAIARECNILTSMGLAVEGKTFRKMSYSERIAEYGPRLEKLQVMARSSPTDKYDLVHMLRGLGEVVGVTGDGTNDARALKEADIGLAMGIAGTEVAKRSSDIIILDDNFASIVTVVRWGRSVYSNIQKFVQFQLTVNLVALSLNFIAAVGTGSAPLTTVQLLWVNLIMDTMGALALATEPPREELMEQKPTGRDSPLITSVMWRNIMVQSIFQLVLLVIYTFEGYRIFDLEEVTGECKDSDKTSDTPQDLCEGFWDEFNEHDKMDQHDTLYLHSIIFNTFVFCQIFNEINARQMVRINVFQGLTENKIFMAIIVFTGAMQVLLIETPASNFVGTVSLSGWHWFICVAVGFLSLPLAAVAKLLPMPDGDSFAEMQNNYLKKMTRSQSQSDLQSRLQVAEHQLEEERRKAVELKRQLLSFQNRVETMEGLNPDTVSMHTVSSASLAGRTSPLDKTSPSPTI